MSKSLFKYLFGFFYLLNVSCTNDNNAIRVIHDTIYVTKNPGDKLISNYELSGTTVLKASEKNLEARWEHGVALDELKSTECLEPQSEHPSPTEIISIKQTSDSTLIITANIDENCGYKFLGEIEVLNNNTLNLIYHGYGAFASCNCLFSLTYKIELFKNEDFNLEKLKYVTINGIAKAALPKLK